MGLFRRLRKLKTHGHIREVDDAVSREPVSGAQFPDGRKKGREIAGKSGDIGVVEHRKLLNQRRFLLNSLKPPAGNFNKLAGNCSR
jgi:hypothetical protein